MEMFSSKLQPSKTPPWYYRHIPYIIHRDTYLVAAPVRGVSSNSKRSDLSNVVHDGILVIGSQGIVTCHTDHRGHLLQVIHTLPAITGAAGHVRPVGVRDGTEELEIVEAELSNRSPAASGTSAGESVGGTAGHLLGGELHQLPGGEVIVGLHLGGEGEGPAAAACSLVLDPGHGALLHPVDGVRQLPAAVPRLLDHLLSGGEAGRKGLQAKVSRLELFLGKVSELVDSFLVRRPSTVVSINLSEVGLEDIESLNFFIEVPVGLFVFQFEIIELLQSALICQSKSHEDGYHQENLHCSPRERIQRIRRNRDSRKRDNFSVY